MDGPNDELAALINHTSDQRQVKEHSKNLWVLVKWILPRSIDEFFYDFQSYSGIDVKTVDLRGQVRP